MAAHAVSGYERAAAAVVEFRRMLPTLTGFVRAMARKHVEVKIGTSTMTDGTTVYLRPPLELADSRIHDRLQCDRRGDDHALLCSACSARETIYSGIYHETAHILYGSFVESTREELVEALISGSRFGRAEFEKRVLQMVVPADGGNPHGVAREVHPYALALFLAVEDVRIDSAAGVARPGVEVMRWNQLEVVLTRGIEREDGMFRWLDAEPEHQVPIAILALLQGHELEGRFADSVIEAAQHPDVDEVLQTLPRESVLDSLCVGVALLGVLEALGVFTLDEDDGSGGEDERPLVGGFSGQAVDADEAIELIEIATGHGHDDDEPEVDDDTLDEAIEQSEMFDEHSDGTRRRVIYRNGEGPAYQKRIPLVTWTSSAVHVPVPESTLAAPVMRARRLFSASRVDGVETGLLRGKLDPALLGRRAGVGDGRVFRRRTRAEGIDWEAVIGIDISGSTDDGDKIAMIRQLAEAMANVLHRVGVRFSVYAHSTSLFEPVEQHLYEIKTADAPWGPQARALLAGLRPTYGSLDGHNFEFYRKILDSSKSRRRMLIYFTDGEIPATNRREQAQIMSREAETCAKRGYSVLGVGIGSDSPTKYGLDTVRIDSGSDIVTVLRELEKRITRN